MSNLKINTRNLNKFKQILADSLFEAINSHGVPEAQSHTPVWSKRLHNSARAENPQVHSDSVTCDLTFGGVSLPGEVREVGIVKDVNYALEQEIEKGFLTSNLPAIGQAIADGLR